MAVVEKDKTVQILYKVQTGATSAGKPTYSTRTVSDINPTITAENAFNIGTAIAGFFLGYCFLRAEIAYDGRGLFCKRATRFITS